MDDTVIPEKEIGRTTNLCEKETNALHYPEFHDLENQNVELVWREVWGVDDATVYDLDQVLASNQIEPTLHIGDKTYDILQFEIWVKPLVGQAAHFITNTMQYSEIEPLIKNLDSRTSIYFSNFLIRDKTGKEV